MSIFGADAANADMIEYWNGAGGRSWVTRQAQQERLPGVNEALFARAALQPGDRVVDIGCGTGVTTVEALRLVGPAGRVLAVDASELMLARARERLGGDPRLTLVQADATTHPFPAGEFAVALSRMGVMFFAEPAKSFANIRRALRAGGRLAFACWRSFGENPWQGVPARAIQSVLPPQPPPAPDTPGPFAFGEEARVRRILGEAGFADVALEPIDGERDLAQGGGLDQAVTAAVSGGPALRLLRDQPPNVVEAARDAVRHVLAPLERDGRIALKAAVWIVSARNP